MRTNRGVFREAFSENEGQTWKEFNPTSIDAGSAPGLLTRLRSGRLFLVWNRTKPEGVDDYPLSGGDGKTWTDPTVIARVTDECATKRLAYPRVFEASRGEIWVTTTYSGFAGYLSVRLFEKDFV